MRRWPLAVGRWRPTVIIMILLIGAAVWTLPAPSDLLPQLLGRKRPPTDLDSVNSIPTSAEVPFQPSDDFSFAINYKGRKLHITDVLTAPGQPSLEERLRTPKDVSKTKYIFSLSSFGAENFGGCPDWNCKITKDADSADGFINYAPEKKRFRGLAVYSNQESPAHASPVSESERIKFHFTMDYRHNSPTASPYGYTVKLHKKHWTEDEVVDRKLIEGKTNGAIWFVSHCSTPSRREDLIKSLAKHLNVSIYGGCGEEGCAKGKCEDRINTEYHFYMALENSVCDQYITEKLWYLGYQFTTIPIVLKRSIVEPVAPPKSFIAFDDYKSIAEMATHLKTLMEDKKAYAEYFEWRRKYAVVFLDGQEHDELERPWGLCQLCRLLQNNRPEQRLKRVPNWAKDACENNGDLAAKLLGKR